jgi:signal transduction histidine kinase
MKQAPTPSRNNIDELRSRALKQFNTAFGLMTIIPLLICIYLVTVRFFTVEILVGANGAYFLAVVVIALLGLLYGRTVVTGVVKDLAETSSVLEWLVREESALNAKLKEAIKKREAAEEELRTMQDRLIQAAKMESVGQLAAGTAHEVKNPLAIITMGLDWMKQRVPVDNADAGLMLRSMENAVQRADRVIRGLLDFAALSELEIAPTDLNAVVEGSLALVKHELDRHNVELDKRLDPGLPPVPIDRNRIEQALVNLLTNAVYAMPEGGKLTVRTGVETMAHPGPAVGRRADDRFRIGERAAFVEILDTGVGIPEETLSRIFEPFFTTRRGKGGTGLGLTVVKNLVDIHEGTLVAQNRPDRGLSVKLFLKLEEETHGGDAEKDQNPRH